MDNHNHEENKIKPGEWAPISRQLALIAHDFCKQTLLLETGDETPRHRKNMSGT